MMKKKKKKKNVVCIFILADNLSMLVYYVFDVFLQPVSRILFIILILSFG